MCRPLFWTYHSANRSKALEASTFDILFKYGLCLVANQEPTYSSRATLQAWPGDIDMETHEYGATTIQLPLHAIQVHDLVDSLHYAWGSGNFIMGCGWCNIKRTDLIVLFLASSTPMILWGLGALHSLFTGFQGMQLSDLMISVNYEIHAPVDMRGLNYKITRIYFKPSCMWTGGCCFSMEEIWKSVATSATFFASTHEMDLAAIFQSLLSSLWSPLQHLFGDCVKTWLGTLVDILIDMNLKQQVHSNLNSQLQSLGCVNDLWCED